mgnify:FL=1|jgi:uncharacterized protein (DUF952 family)
MKSKNTIYHITTVQEWEIYQLTGEVAPDSLFTEGFIHCSRAEQVPDTIERFFSEVDEIMILELDRDALGDSVKDEESSDHGVFPHIYRAVEIDEIVASHKQSV